MGWHPYIDTKPGAGLLDRHLGSRRPFGPTPPDRAPGGVDSIALDETGRRIAAGSSDGGLYVWDFRAGTLLHRKELGAIAPSLHFLDDSGLLVAAGSRLLLLSAEDGAVRRELTLPRTSAAFVVTPDRKQALVATDDGTIHRVLLPGLEIQRSQRVLDADPERKMAISPEGSLVAVTTRNGRRALLLDLGTLEPVAMMPGLESGLRSISSRSTPKGSTSRSGIRISRSGTSPSSATSSPPWASPGARPLRRRSRPRTRRGRRSAADLDGSRRRRAEAKGLLQSGVSASGKDVSRTPSADLQQASEGFAALRKARPKNPAFVRQHAISLGFLAVSLRDLKRPGEALARSRESLAVYESLGNPNPGDLYNMACGLRHGVGLDGRGSPEDREKLEARAVEYLRRAIAGDTARSSAGGDRPRPRPAPPPGRFPRHDGRRELPERPVHAAVAHRDRPGNARGTEDPGRGPHRRRPHARSDPAPGVRLGRQPGGQPAPAQGRRPPGLVPSRCRARRHLPEGPRIRQGYRGRRVADAAAKSSGLRPPDDPTYRAATLAFARSADELGKDTGNAGWFRMGLGIAEYRAGHDEAAVETLRPLIGGGIPISPSPPRSTSR